MFLTSEFMDLELVYMLKYVTGLKIAASAKCLSLKNHFGVPLVLQMDDFRKRFQLNSDMERTFYKSMAITL